MPKIMYACKVDCWRCVCVWAAELWYVCLWSFNSQLNFRFGSAGFTLWDEIISVFSCFALLGWSQKKKKKGETHLKWWSRFWKKKKLSDYVTGFWSEKWVKIKTWKAESVIKRKRTSKQEFVKIRWVNLTGVVSRSSLSWTLVRKHFIPFLLEFKLKHRLYKEIWTKDSSKIFFFHPFAFSCQNKSKL